MSESVTTPDGQPVDLEAAEQEFARAMSTPVRDESEIPAPPKRPTGPGPAGEAKKRGRPPKAERAATPKQAVPVKSDYTQDAQSAVSTVFTITAVLPPTQPLAYVISQSADQLVKALAEGAKHDASIRKIVSGGGNAGWKLQLAAVGTQMALATLQIMRDPEAKKSASEAVKATLAQMVPAPEGQPNGADSNQV